MQNNIESTEDLPDIQREAVEKFGSTNNPYDAGFILSDGRLLNRPKGATFHNYVEGEGSKSGDYAYKFLESGAIRFSRQRQQEGAGGDAASAEFTRKPTESQLERLISAISGAAILALDFTDISTRIPYVRGGKPVTLRASHPKPEAVMSFFSSVEKV